MDNEKNVENNIEDSTSSTQETEMKINQEKLENYIATLKSKQNFGHGVIAGLITLVLCAVIWTIITMSTGYQIGYMALGLGAAVGYSVRFFGKGVDNIYGIMGAFFAALGCFLGNMFSDIGFFGAGESMTIFQTFLALDYRSLPDIMINWFQPMDLIFYAIATYMGFNFSFKQITQEEIIENAGE